MKIMEEKQSYNIFIKMSICAPMPRFKNNIGPKLRARTSKRQEAEIKLGVHILNQMTRLGMSDSVRIR